MLYSTTTEGHTCPWAASKTQSFMLFDLEETKNNLESRVKLPMAAEQRKRNGGPMEQEREGVWSPCEMTSLVTWHWRIIALSGEHDSQGVWREAYAGCLEKTFKNDIMERCGHSTN